MMNFILFLIIIKLFELNGILRSVFLIKLMKNIINKNNLVKIYVLKVYYIYC